MFKLITNGACAKSLGNFVHGFHQKILLHLLRLSNFIFCSLQFILAHQMYDSVDKIQ
jgi:hypothetical protein